MLTDVAAAGVEPAPRLSSPRTRDEIVGRLREVLAWDVASARVDELVEWVRLPADLAHLAGRHRMTPDPATAHARALALLRDVGELGTWDLRQRLKAVEEALWVAGVHADDLGKLRLQQRATDDPERQRAAAVAHAERLTELAGYVETSRAPAA